MTGLHRGTIRAHRYAMLFMYQEEMNDSDFAPGPSMIFVRFILRLFK